VDEMHSEHPELIRDQYWDMNQFDLPYTTASEPYKQEPHIGSAADIEVPTEVRYIPSSLVSIAQGEEARDENEPFMSTSHVRRPTVTSSHFPVFQRLTSRLSVSRQNSLISTGGGGHWKSVPVRRLSKSKKNSVGDEEAARSAPRAVASSLPHFQESTKSKASKHRPHHLPKNGSFVSADAMSTSPYSDTRDEIFQMSDSDSETEPTPTKDSSTVGLVANKSNGGSRDKLASVTSAGSAGSAATVVESGTIVKNTVAGGAPPAATAVSIHPQGSIVHPPGPGSHPPSVSGSYKAPPHSIHNRGPPPPASSSRKDPPDHGSRGEAATGLFPINEDDQPTPDAEDQLSFLNSVRNQLRDLQLGNVGTAPGPADGKTPSNVSSVSSPPIELDVLGRLKSPHQIDDD